MTTDPGDLVLDPTCGSGTTAYVAEQWGRRWITIDTFAGCSGAGTNAADGGEASVLHPLRFTGGAELKAELSRNVSVYLTGHKAAVKPECDIRQGFVYKRVPHITLKSIANNEEIDEIHAKWRPELETVQAQLNRALKQKWEDWEIPREADAKWTDAVKQLHNEWWRLRRDRQKEIDASISKHAETELLYDQPYEDNRRFVSAAPSPVKAYRRIGCFPPMTTNCRRRK